MKLPSLKTSVGSLLLFFLIFFSLFFVQPIYNQMLKTIKQRISRTFNELEEKTGLILKYESISPSILPALSVKGIEVSNKETGKKLIIIKKLFFSYNVFELIKGNYNSAFKKLTVDGLFVDWNDISQKNVRNKLINFISYINDSQETKKINIQHKNNISNAFIFQLPFDIDIRNSTINFENDQIVLKLLIKDVNVSKLKKTDNYEVSFNGSAKAKLKKNNLQFSGDCTASGTIFKNIYGCSMQFHLLDFGNNDFKIEQADFVLSYDKEGLHFETLRSLLPLYISGSMNLETQNINFKAAADNLNPVRYFTIKKSSDIINMLNFSAMSFFINGVYNLKKNSLNYIAKGKIKLAEKNLKNKNIISFDIKGNTKEAKLKEISISGDKCDASLNGIFWFKNFRFSGTGVVKRLQLPGGIVSGDFYFDPLKKGFICFAPQLYIGDYTLTAFQLSLIPQKNSIDFSFEVNDYSHSDADESAKIALSGSYLEKEHYIQAGINIDNLFLDSVADIFSVFTTGKEHETILRISSFLKAYLLSGELYLSSNFKTFTFNVPYTIIADTKKEGRMLVCAFDGNDENINVSKFDMVYGNSNLNLNANISIDSKTKDRYFSTSFVLNSIPYNFNGTISDNWINILGDYGFYASIDLSRKGLFSDPQLLTKGSVSFSNLPVSIKSYIMSVTANTSFKYSIDSGFTMKIDQLYAEEAGSKIAFHPKINISGSINKYGVFFNTINYSDSVSLLEGNCNVLWNIHDNILDSMNISLLLSDNDSASNEKIELKGNITNPQMKAISLESFKNDLFFSFEGDVEHLLLSRFMEKQNNDDTTSFDFSLNGTILSPSLSLNVKDSSMNISGYPALFSGNLSFMDEILTIRNIKFKWNIINISSLHADYSFDTKKGSAGTEINLMNESVIIPLDIELGKVKEKNRIPTSFSLSIKSDKISGKFIKNPFSCFLNIDKASDCTTIFSSQNIGISGYYLNNNGKLFLTTNDNALVKFNVNGSIQKQQVNIKVDKFSTDLAVITKLLNVDFLEIYKGILKGDASLTGNLLNPQVNGNFSIDTPEFSIQGLFPEHFYSNTIFVAINDNQVKIPEFKARENKGYAVCSAHLSFDNFVILSAGLDFNTVPGDRIPVKIDLPFMKAEGPLKTKISLLFDGDTLHLKTLLDMQHTNVSIISSHLKEGLEFLLGVGGVPIDVDITLLFKEHVQFRFDPLLRCIVTPDSMLKINYKSSEGTYQFDGTIGFKGGDVAYLNRNFYLQEGNLIFNPNAQEPRLSLIAETKERDEDGKAVTITISAENQLLSKFKPVISTTPAKSETELQELLGQIVSADSDNVSSLVLATGDYIAQVTVIRRIENTLRDLLNFDIFSIRTQILQNAIKQQLNLEKTTNKYTVGNFLDNSTVYIGKYLGSSLYADAMMAWTYDETKDENNGLVFQPSFGLEMESPFANIRWDIAPDVDAIKNNRWVPSTSITLSWKFTF